MCNVYSFSGFSKVLLKNGIKFSIRDFLDDNKVDQLIQELIDKTCDKYSWVGSGMDRSCFLDPYRLAAIKVSKDIYIGIDDDCAQSEWRHDHWLRGISTWEYDEYGYVIDNLHEATAKKYGGYKQNEKEIEIYKFFTETNHMLLDYIPALYAVSSNRAIEIMEYCEVAKDIGWEDFDKLQPERRRIIEDFFNDTHYGNLGLNGKGKMVILDFGFGLFEDDEEAEYYD